MPMLKRRSGVTCVIDLHDPWLGESVRTVGPGAGGLANLRSRISRFLAARLEPLALRAADAITAVSRATYEPALRRNPRAAPRVAEELPIGWDDRDFERLDASSRPRAGRDGALQLACIGTLPPTMTETVETFFDALRRVRERNANARLRVHFTGTSNQRSDGAPTRALALARAHGVDDLVTETAGRLNYFDTLQAFRDADALLLLGTNEAHYTPSRIYAALNSARPVIAVYHADSPVTDLLRRFGGPPSIRLIPYSAAHPVREHVDALSASLTDLLEHPGYDARTVDRRVLCEASASTLAGRLADVFNRVSATERATA